jgi:hypothetical protein
LELPRRRHVMTHVHETIEIHAAPGDIWAVAGDPARIGEWVPALAGATVEGDRRSCTTGDGATIEERILERSDEERYYTYEITAAPFPVSSYRSTVSVHGHGDHSHVSWEAEFEPQSPEAGPELATAFGEIYRQGLESLRERLEAASAA